MDDFSPGEDASLANEEVRDIDAHREPGYFDKSSGIRLLIASLLALAFFIFFHFREARLGVFEVGGVASSYVVTSVDFQFLDEEATLLQKQDAIKSIGKIYKLPEQEIRQRGDIFEQKLISQQSFSKLADTTGLEEIYQAVNLLEEGLIHARFTDARTLQKIRELQMPASHYELFVPPDPANSQPTHLPPSILTHIADSAYALQTIQPSSVGMVTHFFQMEPWSFEEDVTTEKILQKLVKSQVADKYTLVKSGTRILEEGQKITGRHLSMLNAMRKAMGESRQLWSFIHLAGTFLLIMVIIGVGGVYLRIMHGDVYQSNRKLALYSTIILLTLILAKTIEFFLLNGSPALMELSRFPLLVPFSAILICSLMNARLAVFTSCLLSIILSLSLAVEQAGFLLVNILASLVAVLCTKSLHKRKTVFSVCIKSWLVAVFIVLGLDFYENGNDFTYLSSDLLSTFLFMGFTGILVVGFLPLLETAFRVMTDITLMEYLDPTNDLLRRLTIEAPGTYQHSIVVGNLSEAAAIAIGANGLFCRVATQYHDIGKLIAPHYFTENQQGGVNMHQLLTPLESAQVIISHVSEGVAMARKAGLPEPFIDIIKEHHGTTLVYYFYHKQREMMSGDAALVDEKDFRYSGPKPRSKESAIIMIADTLEAASRSLDEHTEESITALVNRLVAEKSEGGQFDECQLTFEELGIVKKSMVKLLVAVSHSRVKYPPKMKN